MSRGQLGSWDSRTTFVLALAAAAVGFGNLWRFSYLVGTNGGAPFLVLYIACLFAVAVPVMLAEVVIGSHGRGSPVAALRWAADCSLRYRSWALVGLGACITGLLVLAYSTVIAGWALAYAREMSTGRFSAASAVMVGDRFRALLAEPDLMLYWQSLFLLMAVAYVAFGARRGVGLMAWLAVPSLMVLLGVLVLYSLDHGDLVSAREFLFSVRWQDFTAESALVALGHAFFTLGVGVGTGICFGAYAPARTPLGRSVVAVALFDLLFGLGAGLALFPIILAQNVEPAMGPGLLFVAVPYAFGNVVQGELFGTLFFVMVAIAALGSAVAILEPIVVFLMQQLHCSRFFALFISALLVWLLALAAALSLNYWRDQAWLGGLNLVTRLDELTSRWLLPLIALGLVIFVGWRMRPAISRAELGRESGVFFSLWLASLRYIALPAILLLMVTSLGS